MVFALALAYENLCTIPHVWILCFHTSLEDGHYRTLCAAPRSSATRLFGGHATRAVSNRKYPLHSAGLSGLPRGLMLTPRPVTWSLKPGPSTDGSGLPSTPGKANTANRTRDKHPSEGVNKPAYILHPVPRYLMACCYFYARLRLQTCTCHTHHNVLHV